MQNKRKFNFKEITVKDNIELRKLKKEFAAAEIHRKNLLIYVFKLRKDAGI